MVKKKVVKKTAKRKAAPKKKAAPKRKAAPKKKAAPKRKATKRKAESAVASGYVLKLMNIKGSFIFNY